MEAFSKVEDKINIQPSYKGYKAIYKRQRNTIIASS
jgi:hypothetical protein